MPHVKSGSVRFGLALRQSEQRHKAAVFSLNNCFPVFSGPKYLQNIGLWALSFARIEQAKYK